MRRVSSQRAAKKITAGVTPVKKKIVVDIPQTLFEETEIATHELDTTTSDLVRKALEQYLFERRQKKLERELEIGYLANAERSRQINDEWVIADAEVP